MNKNFGIIASQKDVAGSRPFCIRFHGYDVVVFQMGDKFYAVENLCPHQLRSSLHKGIVEGNIVTCPMHGWRYDLQAGNAASGNGRLRAFPLEVRENDLWMAWPESQNNYSLS
jgi:nitrite reductase/ring-hydroxylating ferredoxin subunit